MVSSAAVNLHVQFDAIMSPTRLSQRRRVLELLQQLKWYSCFCTNVANTLGGVVTRLIAAIRAQSRKYSSAFDEAPRNWDTCRMIHYAASNLAGDFPPNREWQSPFLNTQLSARLERTNKSSLRGLGNKAPINGLIIRLPVGLARRSERRAPGNPRLVPGRWIIRNRR